MNRGGEGGYCGFESLKAGFDIRGGLLISILARANRRVAGTSVRGLIGVGGGWRGREIVF